MTDHSLGVVHPLPWPRHRAVGDSQQRRCLGHSCTLNWTRARREKKKQSKINTLNLERSLSALFRLRCAPRQARCERGLVENGPAWAVTKADTSSHSAYWASNKSVYFFLRDFTLLRTEAIRDKSWLLWTFTTCCRWVCKQNTLGKSLFDHLLKRKKRFLTINQ